MTIHLCQDLWEKNSSHFLHCISNHKYPSIYALNTAVGHAFPCKKKTEAIFVIIFVHFYVKSKLL